MKLCYGTSRDILDWMALVKEIKWNFPGLETEETLQAHEQTVLRFMGEKRALCVKENEKIQGVLLFSVKHNMICCLGVAPAARRRGAASMMLKAALERLDRARPITVSTFRAEDPKGLAPRALYKKFGFREGEMVEEFGYPNQLFFLPPIEKAGMQDACDPSGKPI